MQVHSDTLLEILCDFSTLTCFIINPKYMYEAENEHIMSPLKFSILNAWSSLNDLVFSLNRRVERNRMISISYNRSLVLIVESILFYSISSTCIAPQQKKHGNTFLLRREWMILIPLKLWVIGSTPEQNAGRSPEVGLLCPAQKWL